MKNLLLVTLFALPIFSIAQTQLKVTADIRGHACAGGFGLCSTTIIEESKTAGIIAQKISNTTVLFIIDKQNLTIENQKSLAGNEFSKIMPTEKIDFKQEANILFDPKTLLNLGFDPKYNTIKTGTYPMIIENDKVLITFTLSEK